MKILINKNDKTIQKFDDSTCFGGLNPDFIEISNVNENDVKDIIFYTENDNLVQHVKKTLFNILHSAASKYQNDRCDANGVNACMAKQIESPTDCAKAKANTDWVKTLWADYYTRKQEIINGSIDINLDFSNNGELPYSIYEI